MNQCSLLYKVLNLVEKIPYLLVNMPDHIHDC